MLGLGSLTGVSSWGGCVSELVSDEDPCGYCAEVCCAVCVLSVVVLGGGEVSVGSD